MMTDKQLRALLHCIGTEAGRYSPYIPTPDHEARAARRELIEAFGFETDKRARAVIVPGTAQIPLRNLDGNKVAAIREVLDRFEADMHTDRGAPEIARLWPELKAIMEPGAVTIPTSEPGELLGYDRKQDQ